MAKSKLIYGGVVIPIDNTGTYQINANGELSSGVVTVPKITNDLAEQFKIDDDVELLIGEYGVQNCVVVDIRKHQYKQLGSTKYCDLTLSLVEKAYELQGYLLPNITITQPLFGARRTVRYAVNRMLSIAKCPYNLDSQTGLILNSVECPEMSWNKRNLYEILCDLFYICGLYPRIDMRTNSFVISSRKLNGDEVSDESVLGTSIIDFEQNHHGNEYATELEMNAVNVVGADATTFSQHWISPRSNDYVMGTDNAMLILEKPIYYVDRIKMQVQFASPFSVDYYIGSIANHHVMAFNTSTLYEFDITDWLVEKEVYQSKLPYDGSLALFGSSEIVPGGDSSNPVIGATELDTEIIKYKRMFLNFSMGNTIIEGLCFKEDYFLSSIDATQYSLNMIAKAMVMQTVFKLGESTHEQVYITLNASQDATRNDIKLKDPREALFDVEYTSLNQIRFRTVKDNIGSMNPRATYSNQDSSYVDAYQLGLKEQENVNRIGNPTIQVSYIVDEFSELLFDSIDSSDRIYHMVGDDKYYMTSIQFQLNGIGSNVVIANFTKDYQRKNYFTGILSKARWTSISNGSDALLRQDISNYFVKLSHSTGETISSTIFNLVVNKLGERTDIVALVESSEVIPLFYLPISVYRIGNNHIIFEFRFKDNVSAGMYVDGTSSNKYVCKDLVYTDENGEMSNFFYEIQAVKYDNAASSILAKAKKYPQAYNLGSPVTSFDDDVRKVGIIAKKDNREIYGVCVNFNISGNSSEGITIYKEYYDVLPFVAKNDVMNIKLYFITNNTYTVGYSEAVIDSWLITNSNDGYIEFNRSFVADYYGIDESTIAEWGIAIQNGANFTKLLKVINNPQSSATNRIYYIKK